HPRSAHARRSHRRDARGALATGRNARGAAAGAGQRVRARPVRPAGGPFPGDAGGAARRAPGVSEWLAFVAERLPALGLRTGEHIVLTGVSTLAAIALGLPLGIAASRLPHLRGVILALVGVLQTIPSLAMLAFLLTLLNRIGALPAVLALVLYALLPIVRNTLAGLAGVAPAVREAADGIGMTPRQRLWWVELPLAAPVIVAGIRTAAVVGVGIATLSAFIGAGGLGQFINRGLALSNHQLILLGAVPSALLALLVDASIAGLEWAADPRRHRRRSTARVALRRVAWAFPALLLAAPPLALLAGAGGGSAGRSDTG